MKEEAINFGKWIAWFTSDAGFTQAPCRVYENKTYTIVELYEIYKNL